ncbi:UPF0769 protein C21orf59-like protein [Hypsibius exemplaris]|uniref:UPF0769 protein C21orf59-like protein n=1 Tax=Hypsibius exemplaris TaxID=2072580 RepID=A0A1W0WBD3_HYPEX|nr:UPF0769 protein C21orf59-like protein [Hypsibius exemplaris]
MVRLHVKKGDDDLFLFDTPVDISVHQITRSIVDIHNGRLKIGRMAAEMENLANHGIHLPPNMVGLMDDQIAELKLKDEFAQTHTPSGGVESRKDEFFRRNGQAPLQNMAKILTVTAEEARNAVHKNLVKEGVSLTPELVKEQWMKLKGAVMIVYPMGLPLHDPLEVEMSAYSAWNLDAGYGGFRDVMDEDKTALWWAGKELKSDRQLKEYIGGNDKTRLTVKMAEKGKGGPAREPVFTEEQKKAMMAHAFRRQQELEKLEEDDDDHYLNSKWADSSALKMCFQGIKDIQIRPS